MLDRDLLHLYIHGMLTELEKKVIASIQGDIPISPRPYLAIADHLAISEQKVLAVVTDLKNRGVEAIAYPLINKTGEENLNYNRQYDSVSRSFSLVEVLCMSASLSWKYRLVGNFEEQYRNPLIL